MVDFRQPYNLGADPHFQKAMTDLGKMFAPPDARDVYFGAQARKTRQEADSLAALYAAAQQPMFDEDRFSRLALAAGQNPAQYADARATSADAGRRQQVFDMSMAPGATLDSIDVPLIGAGIAAPNESFGAVRLGEQTKVGNNVRDNARAVSVAGIEQAGANWRETNNPLTVAEANAANAEAARLASLFEQARQPGVTPGALDLQAVMAGVYRPDQSYLSVDMADATDNANNVRDNSRAVRTTAMEQAGQTERAMLDPLGEGQTRFVPPSLADLFQVSEQQRGNIMLGQGETAVLPDSTRMEGVPKPLSETEAQAQVFQGLPPEMQAAIVGSDVNVETVMTPEGPRVVSRMDSIGQEPYSAPSSQAAPKVENYRTPDGRTGTARFDATRGWVDSQTGEPLPQGSATFALQAQGAPGDLGIAPTVANQTEANRAEARLNVLQQLTADYRALLQSNPGIVGIPGTVRGAAQDVVTVLDEFRQAFGNLPGDAQVTEDMVSSFARQIAPNRDPAIQQARLLASDLAYKYAQAQNPSGEVSRQAFERSLETLTGGMLRNNQSALESLDGIDALIQRERQGVESLRGPGNPTPPPAPGAGGAPAERWERGPDGRLRKVE